MIKKYIITSMLIVSSSSALCSENFVQKTGKKISMAPGTPGNSVTPPMQRTQPIMVPSHRPVEQQRRLSDPKTPHGSPNNFFDMGHIGSISPYSDGFSPDVSTR